MKSPLGVLCRGLGAEMGGRYASENIAAGICDRCGFRYKLKTLQKLTVNKAEISLRVCEECWEADHPQNYLGDFPIDDPQALRDPRPDAGERTTSREITLPDGYSTVEEYLDANI